MDNTFLLVSLFFPRLVLIAYYLDARIPSNIIPFWGDVVLSVFVPRLLVLLYIYTNLGADNGWFWAHLIAAILCYTAAFKNTECSCEVRRLGNYLSKIP
jgi:hypothetical protein